MGLVRTITINDVKYVMQYPGPQKRTTGTFIAADEIVLALGCIFSTTPEIYAEMIYDLLHLNQETVQPWDVYNVVLESKFWAIFKILLGISHDMMFRAHFFTIFQCIVQLMPDKLKNENPRVPYISNSWKFFMTPYPGS